MYSQLDLGHIARTLAALRSRIGERFPNSGLEKVTAELCQIAEQTGPILQRAARPHWPLRLVVGAVVVLFAAVVGALIAYSGSLSYDVQGIGDMLQAVESALQDVIFFSIAVYFLFTLEARMKRRVALRELHRLRSIVHIVDMHQLTKDPEHLLSPEQRTASSPKRQFNRFQLARYLDYCTELLSLSSKLAALHVQHLNDPVVLNAVNDVETLAANLSNKIWQKIVILDTVVGRTAIAAMGQE
ncbi:MAG TPA: hypothetical protein VFO52_12205 [Longimicrobiales bacterium]|nr:hypothetical protein [Longimicrobiales bacterium]